MDKNPNGSVFYLSDQEKTKEQKRALRRVKSDLPIYNFYQATYTTSPSSLLPGQPLPNTLNNLAENKISQMKEAAIKEIKDASIKIAVDSVKKIISTSVDKSKLDAVFQKNLNETKEELKKINS